MSEEKMSSGCTCTCFLFNWSRDITAHLCILYREQPILYKIKPVTYYDRYAQDKALREICDVLNTGHRTTLTVSDIRTKINELRTSFFGELDKQEKSECSGPSPDNSQWWCFKMLTFLRDHSSIDEWSSGRVEPGPSNMSHVDAEEKSQEEEEPEISDGDISEASVMSPTSSNATVTSRPGSSASCTEGNPPPKKRQKIAAPPLPTGGAKKVPTVGRNSVFGQMLSQEMERIDDEEIMDDLKEDIMGALFRAKKRQREKKNQL